jgi:hypothetical protein
MAVPSELKSALHEAVRRHSQPDAVSSRLLALLEEVYSGNESLDDREAMRRHVESILESLAVPQEGEDEQ